MKKQLLSYLLSFILLLNVLPLAACSPKMEKYSIHSFDYFDTVTTVTGYAESREDFDRVANALLSELGEYHRLFTIYHRYEGLENLCTVNELVDGHHRTVTVERRIVDLLLYAKDMHDLTGGRVNVAMGSVLSIWHDFRTEGLRDPAVAKLPSMDKLEAAAAHTDIRNLVIDETACTVTVTDPAMTLDVGAIAKGYAVERVAESLEKQGIRGYVLNVGGNVRAVGGKADGTGWLVGIENPQEGEEYLDYLSLTDLSLVTSGSYQRCYVVDGKSYHHIIHPDTLMPAEGYLSVSVITPDSAAGDALSTALFCMTVQEGMTLLSTIPHTEALWVLSDGTRHTTDGWETYTS